MRFILKILLFNQALGALFLAAALLLLGPARMPEVWLPILLSVNAIGTAIQVLARIVFRSGPYRGAPKGVQTLVHLGVVVAGTASGLVLCLLAIRLARPRVALPLGTILANLGFPLLVAGLVSALRVLYFRQKARIEQHAVENQKLRELEARTRLAALQSKVHPHFLFNTLNTMVNLARTSPGTLETLILEVSELYRRILLLPEDGTIPLSEELEIVRRYLAIEQVRLGSRLAFSLEVDPAAASRQVPPMVVEPLVENALKHGIGPRPRGGRVRIVAWDEVAAVRVRVEDDGDGDGEGSREASPGFGLYSIRERLRMIYGGRARLDTSEPGKGGFRADLEVPHEP
jgi:hypothetical protein